MQGIKREYEEWTKFVDDIKRKKIEEVFYTIKAVKPNQESGSIAIYAIFSAIKEFKNQDGTPVTHFFLHTSFISEFATDTPSETVMNTINPIIDKNYIQALQLISIPTIIRGQVHEV